MLKGVGIIRAYINVKRGLGGGGSKSAKYLEMLTFPIVYIDKKYWYI